MTMRIVWAAMMGTAVLSAWPAAAQSLADVARKEEARRHETGTPVKAYTNADLKPDPNGTPTISSATAVPAPAAPGSSAAADLPAAGAPESGNASPDAASPADPPADDKKSAAALAQQEAYWRGAAKSILNRIDAAQRGISQVSQAPVPNEREKARVDALLTRFQNQLEMALDDLELLRTRAGAAGIPQEWIADQR